MEELLRPIIERCRGPTMQALQDAKLSPNDIDKIILIGGPTRMPMVRQFVATVMGKEPERGVDPMEAVAMGAAIQGAVISGDVSTDILLVDVTPLTLGVEVLGGLKEAIIERNTTIPTKKSKIFTHCGRLSNCRNNTRSTRRTSDGLQTVFRLGCSIFLAYHRPQEEYRRLKSHLI